MQSECCCTPSLPIVMNHALSSIMGYRQFYHDYICYHPSTPHCYHPLSLSCVIIHHDYHHYQHLSFIIFIITFTTPTLIHPSSSLLCVHHCPASMIVIIGGIHHRQTISSSIIIIMVHHPSATGHQPASIIHQRPFFCHHEPSTHHPSAMTHPCPSSSITCTIQYIHSSFLPQQGAKFLLDAKSFTLPKSQKHSGFWDAS